jgi:hypothetical protein
VTQRRNAREWAELIGELERSGQDAVAFARARGIRPDTLKWWQWRVRRDGRRDQPKQASKRSARVKLIAVQPVREAAASERETALPVWEIVAPTGYELRVYDRRGLGVLRAALFAVAGGRRR